MKAIDDVNEQEWAPASRVENPFAELLLERPAPPAPAIGFAAWNNSLTPFVDREQDLIGETESDQMLAEVLAELHDEEFDEAVAYLAEETEQYVSERFAGEAYGSSPERERFAAAHLSAVGFEAEQYLSALETGLAGLDLGSLAPDSLAEVLDRFDPAPADLSPAGEEFIGGLIRKAKKAVSSVANAAKKVGAVVASPLIAPLLKKLRGLIDPLLKRVLSFAIGRLPALLQPAARQLADKIAGAAKKAEAEMEDMEEAPMSPASSVDMEAIAQSFDTALAEAIIEDPSGEFEHEGFDTQSGGAVDESHELERLAQARQTMVDRLQEAGEDENLAPVVEQFIPAILGALRLGIKLIGRPKVVNFLAKYLGQLIGKWVGPTQSGPLSAAIVNAGLQMASLEAESEYSAEAGPNFAGSNALASVVEDTVRRLAENEDYVFEDEGLMQLAAAEAFGQAVATHFPSQFVRANLQQAPTLGGTFISHHPRSARSYAKYSMIPEVELSEQVADELPAFGGSTVGAAMRAAGAAFPVKARVHVYQAKAGTTVPNMVRTDRKAVRGTSPMHPLTPYAAGLLLREPRLGVAVPSRFLKSRHRIAAGQRLYRLEPVGGANGLAPPAGRRDALRLAPSRAWISVHRPQARISVGFYIAEVEAQQLADAIRQGRGPAALLQKLTDAFKHIRRHRSGAPANNMVAREGGEDFEDFAASPNKVSPAARQHLRRRIRSWVLPALSKWVAANSEAFVRAVAHPDAGVTIRVRLSGVPGLNQPAGPAINAAAVPSGTPAITITVNPGKKRP
ncbi:hypothetical protein [Sphingopyxis sp.]|uniref:hypothetical protein n=1 Tax=Sphingopyxis sp. TaxID=1908224 RepID=UPI002FC94AB1